MSAPTIQLLDLGGPIVRVMRHASSHVSVQIYTQPNTQAGCYEPAQFVDVYLTPENLQALVQILEGP